MGTDQPRQPQTTGGRQYGLKGLLLAAILAIGAVVGALGWDDYSVHLGDASPGWLMLAVGFLIIGNLTSVLVATELLRSRGHEVDEVAVGRVVLVSNVAKYIPGFVLQLATFYRMSRDIGLGPRRSWLLWLETTWMNVVVAAALGSIALLIAGGDIHWLLPATVLIGACALAVPSVRDLALRVARVVPEGDEKLRGLQPRAVALAAMGVVALGFHGVAIARAIGATEIGWFEVVAALAGGWIFGLVLVIFPGGFGPREVAAAALLSQFTDTEVAIVIVALSRLASVLADVLAGAVAALLPQKRIRLPESPQTA